MVPLEVPRQEPNVGFWTLAVTTLLQGAEYWADTACDRGVSGQKGHSEHMAKLAEAGMKPIRVDEQEEYIFGDGASVVSVCSYVYPVITNGKYRGKLRQAMVDVPCPRLLSKAVLKQWACNLKFGDEVIELEKFGHSVPFKRSTPVIDLAEYKTPPLLFDKAKAGVPLEFWTD